MQAVPIKKRPTSPLLVTGLVIMGLVATVCLMTLLAGTGQPGAQKAAAAATPTATRVKEPIELTRGAGGANVATTMSPTPAPISTATLVSQPTNNPPIVLMGLNDTPVNMRGGPGTGYAVIGALQPGQIAAIIGKTADAAWWKVTYYGKDGWVSASVAPTAGDLAHVAVVDYAVTPATGASEPTWTAAPATTWTPPPTQVVVTLPTQTVFPTQPPAACVVYRTGAICRDGSLSNATGSGACSHHGGVSFWTLSKCP